MDILPGRWVCGDRGRMERIVVVPVGCILGGADIMGSGVCPCETRRRKVGNAADNWGSCTLQAF